MVIGTFPRVRVYITTVTNWRGVSTLSILHPGLRSYNNEGFRRSL